MLPLVDRGDLGGRLAEPGAFRGVSSRLRAFRAKSRALGTRQAAPQCGTADHAADIAPPWEASKTAESENAAHEPLMPAAPPAEPARADAASSELDQAILAQAAELGQQPGFPSERNAPRPRLPRPPHPGRIGPSFAIRERFSTARQQSLRF